MEALQFPMLRCLRSCPWLTVFSLDSSPAAQFLAVAVNSIAAVKSTGSQCWLDWHQISPYMPMFDPWLC